MIHASHYEIILYVQDQQRSTVFYSKILGKEPVLNVPGMTEFELAATIKLGLMPESSIAKILGDKAPHPSLAGGIPRAELYIIVEDVEEAFELAIQAGAKELSPILSRDWGHTACYLLDPDGHVIAFAREGV